mmetsp:Transcript_10587/g.23504  ORF Transcript_10587/g.23504 Transcript_10587/m.23504 type:complete len:144 (+) Transcript_10587:789-1220(+)
MMIDLFIFILLPLPQLPDFTVNFRTRTLRIQRVVLFSNMTLMTPSNITMLLELTEERIVPSHFFPVAMFSRENHESSSPSARNPKLYNQQCKSKRSTYLWCHGIEAADKMQIMPTFLNSPSQQAPLRVPHATQMRFLMSFRFL